MASGAAMRHCKLFVLVLGSILASNWEPVIECLIARKGIYSKQFILVSVLHSNDGYRSALTINCFCGHAP